MDDLGSVPKKRDSHWYLATAVAVLPHDFNFVGCKRAPLVQNRIGNRHPDVVKAVDGVIEKARARKIPYGLPTWTPEECLSYVNRGGQFLTLGGDLHFLSTGARGILSQMRNLLKA